MVLMIMGGPSATARTGQYTTELAQSIVKGLPKLFGAKEVLAVDEVPYVDAEEIDDQGFVDFPAAEEPQDETKELNKLVGFWAHAGIQAWLKLRMYKAIYIPW